MARRAVCWMSGTAFTNGVTLDAKRCIIIPNKIILTCGFCV